MPRQHIFLSLVFLLCLVLSTTAQAATFTVNSTADDTTTNGECTLREAVLAVNNTPANADCVSTPGPNTITFAPGITAITLTDSTYILIYDTLTITGNPTTITAEPSSLIFNVQSTNTPLTLNQLTLTGGV